MRSTRIHTLLLATFSGSLFVISASPVTVQAPVKNPSSRTAAPPFSLAAASGQTWKLSDFRGRVVLLNFWATHCGGCRLEIPWLADLDQNFRNQKVAVIGISMDITYEDLKNTAEAWAKVKPFTSAHQIRYLILMENSEVTKRYDVQALPVTYLIDPRGRIAATYVGLIDKQNVETNIRALLTERQ